MPPQAASPIRFRKMHGAGNDFVVLDGRQSALELTPVQIAAIADRRIGIGCDQLIVMDHAGPQADAFMHIYNNDGTQAGACGNATRCVAMLLFQENGRQEQVIRTVSGSLTGRMLPDGRVEVDMGPPRLEWEEIPLSRPANTLSLPLPGDPAAASMGNPHATLFVPDLDTYPVEQMGPVLEHDPLFPDRANIGFAQILAPDRIRLRVWERGAGLTLACGSGACAALVNAHRLGLAGRRADMVLDGGLLTIEWRQQDGHVLMTGPVVSVYTGELNVSALPS